MMPALILAGGLAVRMRPVTESLPKSMIDIRGKPFIEHQLMLLHRHGITHVIMCVGFLGGMIEDYIGDGKRFDMYVEYHYDGEVLLGTGGAIKRVADRLPEAFFVLYGDSYLDVEYGAVERAFYAAGKPALMTVYKNDNALDTSNVVYEHQTITKYCKTERTADMRYIDWGLGAVRKTLFDTYPANTRFDLALVYEELANKRELAGYEVFERFYEIGSFSGLEDLRVKLRGAV